MKTLGRAFQPEGTAYAKALGDAETNPIWKSAVPRTQGVLWGMSQARGGCQLDPGLNVPLRGPRSTLLAIAGRQKLAPKGDICRSYGSSSWPGWGEAQGESQVTVARPGSGQ